MSEQRYDNTPITGCSGCQTTAGRWGCPKHSPNVYVSEPTINLYSGDGMGGEVKLEEEKWEKEFEKLWDLEQWNYSEKFQFAEIIKQVTRYFYLQARKARQKDEIILKLAFKDGKFSGIIVNNQLIEDGEVVEYIKKGQVEIKGLNIKINHLAEDIKQMEETIRKVNNSPIRKHFDRSYRSQE